MNKLRTNNNYIRNRMICQNYTKYQKLSDTMSDTLVDFNPIIINILLCIAFHQFVIFIKYIFGAVYECGIEIRSEGKWRFFNNNYNFNERYIYLYLFKRYEYGINYHYNNTESHKSRSKANILNDSNSQNNSYDISSLLDYRRFVMVIGTIIACMSYYDNAHNAKSFFNTSIDMIDVIFYATCFHIVSNSTLIMIVILMRKNQYANTWLLSIVKYYFSVTTNIGILCGLMFLRRYIENQLLIHSYHYIYWLWGILICCFLQNIIYLL